MSKKLRAAVIGCGGAGLNHLIGYGLLEEQVEIVAAVDVRQERAIEIGEQFSCAAYTDYEQMIAEQRPDVVSVCTREYAHAGPAIYALSQGVHVLSEKIMAHDIEEGRQMLEAAQQHDRLLAVNYNYRYIDAIRQLKQYLDEGRLGELYSAVFTVHVFCHHHTMDLLRFLFGEPESVSGNFTEDLQVRDKSLWDDQENMLYVPDRNACTVVRFGSLLVSVHAVRRDLHQYPLIDLQVVGSKGTFAIADMMIANMNGVIRIHTEDEQRETVLPPLPLEQTFYRSVAGWVERVQNRPTIAATGEDGWGIMLLEQAISRSQQEKRIWPLGVSKD